MRTADDDSVPIPHDAFTLPRPILSWGKRPLPDVTRRPARAELDAEDTDVTRVDPFSGSRTSIRASNDELDDEPTRAIQIPIRPQTPERSEGLQALLARMSADLDLWLTRGAARLRPLLTRVAAGLDAQLPGVAAQLRAARTRTAKLWRDQPLRAAAIVAGALLVAFLAVAALRRGSDNRTQTVLAPAVPLPAVAPIIVEQLNGARQPASNDAALDRQSSDKSARRNASTRARAASLPATPARKSGGPLAPAQSKPPARRAERSSTSSSAGLPAWGAEAVSEFKGGKSARGSVSSQSQALSAKPASSNPDIPPPMAAYRSSAREQPKPPPVTATAAEPAKPVAPPAPRKPLTMDEVLNQVEEAAQAQRKQAGLKAAPTNKRDAELDELISGAMKSKTK